MINEADLVVVGGGPGGMAAALEAATFGASVILLEADTQIGGNAARSTGYLAFQNFDMQAEEGVTDNAEIFVQDMVDEIARQNEKYGITFDEDLAWLFSEESSDTYTWLRDLGFEFNRFLPRPKQHSVKRMIDVKDTTMFTSLFEKALETAGVKVITDTRVRRLLTLDESVVGVATDTDSYKAKKAVVLATGGYQANPQIRIKYQPEAMASTPYLGTEHDVGDGHLMGQEVGGDISCIDSDTDWDLKKVEPHVQYYNDRGEKTEPRLDLNEYDFFINGEEYAYIFDDGEWVCYDLSHKYDDDFKATGYIAEPVPIPSEYPQELNVS